MHFHGGGIQQVVALQPGGHAVEIQRLGLVCHHTESLFVEVAQVDLGAGKVLLGCLGVPECGRFIIRLQPQAFLVDFAHVGLRFGITGLGLWQPDFQGGGIVGAIEGHVFPAPDGAVGGGGLDGAAGSQVGRERTQLFDLSRQQTVDDHQVIGILAVGGRATGIAIRLGGAGAQQYRQKACQETRSLGFEPLHQFHSAPRYSRFFPVYAHRRGSPRNFSTL